MAETSQREPVRPASWFAQVRAVLVALHLLAITLLALPSAGEGTARWAWKDPTVQHEFAAWTARLNGLGVRVTQEEFEDDLWAFDSTYESVRGRVTGPFNHYYAECGTFQSWRMFAGPQRYPSRLHIDVQEAGAWKPIYVQRDPDHAWLAGQLDQYRMRPVLYRLSWYRHVPEFDDFRVLSRWVAARAARDFPEASRVRVHFFTFRSPPPDEVRAGEPVEGEFTTEEVLDLGGR
jgi:hypothetical protein